MSEIKRAIINELHKSSRKNFKRRRFIVKGLDETFQADLVEMIPYEKINKGFRYILVVIDIFSKYVWTVPVKNKNATCVTTAMENILLTDNRIPKNLHTDLGKEFHNKQFKELMKKYKINHYSTYSNKKAAIVERVNRTLKSLMWKELHTQGSYKWIDILPKITLKYNTTKHRTIKMKPVNVNKKNEKSLLKTVYNHIKIVDYTQKKFQVGDKVRISTTRGIFSKGYEQNWSTEIFTIGKIQLTNPISYLLIDESGQFIKGGFYKEELQKVQYSNVYLIEKVLKRKGNKIFVKWLGFDNTHNSWIKKNDLK